MTDWMVNLQVNRTDAQGESLISHVYTCADSADIHFELCTG